MNKYFVIAIVVITAALIGAVAYFSRNLQPSPLPNGAVKLEGEQNIDHFSRLAAASGCSVPATGSLDDFAKCLADKKVTMYGAYWCTHCQADKAAFGNSFKYVPYVECTEKVQECLAAGVEGYPTWIISNPIYVMAPATDSQKVHTDSNEQQSRSTGEKPPISNDAPPAQ